MKLLACKKIILAVGCCIALPLLADDIEVFSTGGDVKPNILFVFDRSGSMLMDVDGNETSDGSAQRATILRESFKSLLEANKDKINAGMGPFFRSSTSGVKWPIGDLTQNAHEIDANIPEAEGWTSQAVIDKLFDPHGQWGNTNIVDALYESALYFRGGEVRADGGSWDDRYEPHVWLPTTQSFVGGDYKSPHPATYSPSNAYTANAVTLPDSSGTCEDFSIGGTTTGLNFCGSSGYTRYDSCTLVAAVPGSGTACLSSERICNATNADGECTDSEVVCLTTGPAPDTPAHNSCTGYTEGRTEGSWAGANYNSPISDSCQSNYIVLLSDGEPTRRDAESEVMNMIGASECIDFSTTLFSSSVSWEADTGNCGVELLEFLSTNDQVSTIPGSIVNTYTIGFGVGGSGQEYLKALASAGGGEFFAANDASQLSAAFDGIVASISSQTETFTAVSVDVDKASFSSDNRAFFSLFKPGSNRSWAGNLKGYFIDSDGIKDVTESNAITTTDAGAVFSESSQSFWSVAPDGNDVTAGGASGKLNPASRNLYTYTGNTPFANASLTIPAHALDSTNTNITSTMLEGANPSVIDALRNSPMADPLHTQPVTIKYQDRTVLYTMTNQGLLHAFDATTPIAANDTSGGTELWAFMPQALLKNLGRLEANLTTGEHIYGLDGGITRWLDERTSADGVITSGEEATLYIGMRRGGNHYYAIDVSNPLSPRLKWRLDGGSSELKNLGQSWSRMALTTMKKSGVERKILVFGGGYDDALDGTTERTAVAADGSAILGNDVYIVDALDGTVLWSANNDGFNSNMKYAIPADLNVIDSDQDGITDRMYFGDLGGQLWRIDFPDGEVGNASAVSVKRLAELGTDTSFQPFFYQTSVALINQTSSSYLSIGIGSGSRDNPLYANSENRIYMVRDVNIEPGAPSDSSAWPYTEASLYDATLDMIGSTDPTVVVDARNTLDAAAGWMVKLAAGEKILSQTTIFQNELLFTSYRPDTGTASTVDACTAVGSTGSYYRMDARNARPVKASGDGPMTDNDRSTIISKHGIPGPATIVFPQNSSNVDIYVGQEKVSEIEQSLQRVLWYAK